MIGDEPKISDSQLLKAINDIFHSESIRDLKKVTLGALNLRYGSYHHLPPIGSQNFDILNQFWGFNLPQSVVDYLQIHGNSSDPVMKYVLKRARPFWISQLQSSIQNLADFDGDSSLFTHRLELVLTELSDGILMPVFGPSHKTGYVFINFHHPKEYYDEIFIWQLQSLLKAAHVQYCILSESFRQSVHLTRRESEVLALITFGQSNQQIAETLKISPNTVAGYVKQLYLKIGVTDRVQAAMKAHNFIALGGNKSSD